VEWWRGKGKSEPGEVGRGKGKSTVEARAGGGDDEAKE
jgi:hypothetical protein